MNMALKEIDFVNGISSIIFVIISIIIGLSIVYKYFKLEDRAFLFIGLGLMAISEPWIPSAISFLWNLGFGEGISLELYILLGNVFIPLGILCWLVGFTDLVYPEKQKSILAIFFIIGAIFELILFILLFNEPTLIGEFSQGSTVVRLDIEYKSFIMGYLLFVAATVFITGMTFAYVSLKSENPAIKIKGKFLVIAIILWSGGAVFDTFFPLNIYTLPITRISLLISSIMFYMGFLTPAKIRKFALKE
jgi:hypothetical protein